MATEEPQVPFLYSSTFTLVDHLHGCPFTYYTINIESTHYISEIYEFLCQAKYEFIFNKNVIVTPYIVHTMLI